MTELRKIPNVGKQTEQDLIAMGYTTVKSLRGKRAEDLYAEECRLRGCVVDRCQLYLYRAVEYFVNTENPDPAKCKWWLWKDELVEPSPCGAVCAECGNFPSVCGGCRKIRGKVFWLQFTGDKVCPVYQCCREKKKRNCSGCLELPCARFMKDPTISDEENEVHLQKMLERLGKTTIRPLRLEEITMLRDFLYEAIYLPEGTPSPPRSVMDLPELQVYIQNFGTRSDDHCLVAESSDKKVIGAVWVRQMEDYGHVDDHTPSLAIALYQGFRGKGIGTRLLQEMIDLLHRKGYKQVSLSVQKANPAVRLYRRLGFETIRETEEEYIMVYQCMKTNYQQFLSGEYCNHLDAEVLDIISRTNKLLTSFNSSETSEEKKLELLTQMLGSIGPHTSIGRNFTCQCGKHIFLGEKTIINMNCTMMDENHIHIGNRVLIAPNVQFYTATHPIDACERFVSHWDETSGELFFRTRSLPITVGNDVWIGGGSIILPGVTIGNNCVIGAGSIVNKSIPANSVAVGNPCRVIRRLKPAVTFRPATATDIPELKELFCNTVLTVNARDYTAEEAADWASCGNRPGHWEELMATLHFIAACDAEGRIVSFTSIRNDGYLHSMFVHKDHQGEGIATALLQQIEAYAMEHGICDITSEVSITARPFFERRGYVVEQEQRAQANRLKLTNYIMKKQLKKI